jgi:glycosyl transferase family 2
LICVDKSRRNNNFHFDLTCPPVLLLAFNRPDTTARVLQSVQAAQPGRLYLAVDGPRDDRPEDAQRVRQVQELAANLPWSSEVRTLFRDRNLGCKLAVSQAITWFFSEVDAGIILEDDCVAHPSFFPYAAELLERYRDDERIMMISGDNFQHGRRRAGYSYYFSRYTHIWGWATWRRAWQRYDHRMAAWPELRDGGWLMDVLGEREAAEYWARVFEETFSERNNSWAYRWMFAAWSHSGLTVLPSVNLVSNIGFGEQATHTLRHDASKANLGLGEMVFPLRHPPYLIRDAQADAYSQRHLFPAPGVLRRAAGRAGRLLLRSRGR